MSRDHARIQTAIWSDPDFRELPESAQRMYFLALSQPQLNYCGVLDFMPIRLAKFSANSTPRTVASSVAILEARGFVVVDPQTSELLVRSFIRHDGLLDSPNVVMAMVKDFHAVLSEDIRKVITDELGRAHTEKPDLKGWRGLREKGPDLYRTVTGRGLPKGSAND